jgi:hypothetical protein
MLLLVLFVLLCLSAAGMSAVATSHVVINEFEQNPAGEDSGNEWVELFNPTNQAVNASGWMLIPTRNRLHNVTLEAGSIIPALGYLMVPPPSSQWLDNEWEIIVLRDAASNIVDMTLNATDTQNDDRSWQRFPNGQDTDADVDWVYLTATRSFSNGAETVTTTTTTSLTTTTSTTQVTTATTQTTTQQTTTATTEHTTTMTTVEPSPGMGWVLALVGIMIAMAAAGGGVAAALSGRQYPQVFTYDGQTYCTKHRVPVWYVQGHLWCPVEQRYLRP